VSYEDDRMDEWLRYVHTMLVGRVTAADNANQRVDVEILTQRAFKAAESVMARPIQPLLDVPVGALRTDRGGDFVDLDPGDLVLVFFSMHSTAEVVTSEGDCGPVAPALVDTHGLGGAFALPFSLKKRPATSAGAAREIISDDLQLGRPNASHHVVLEGLQGVLNDFADLMYDALVDAAGNTPPALNTIFFGTIPKSQHVKVS
jgi:hypothetical protein